MRIWTATLRPRQFRRIEQGVIDLSPPQLLALTFVMLGLVGGLLLKIPAATTEPITWMQALFTAMSAVTVTGLAVLDTGLDFTYFGQTVILILMQLGGLGLMTFGVLIMQIFGERLGLRHQIILREALNQTALGDLRRLVKLLLSFAFAMEFFGMLLLAVQWVPERGLWDGMFWSLFHAVSAFNNAGFGLASDSLSGYVGNPLVNVVITLLFITGGLGFTVIADLRRQQRFQQLRLHTKLMLSGTLIINLVAMLVFFLLEYSNPASLGGLSSWADKLWASWFQAVTTRTAGFNSLDIGSLRDATALFMMALMFIGAGSASTASGIKLTTFIILLLATRAFLRQEDEASVFGRSIRAPVILKALAITVSSVVLVLAATFLLTLTEKHDFLDIAFEVVSAFGTVGLSRGITADLSIGGQCIIMLLMLVGRIGPLTLAFTLAARRTPRVRYPSDDVHVG